MKKLLLATATFLGMIYSAQASDFSLPIYMNKHQWAIENTFNCSVPSKAYAVQFYSDGPNSTVVWRDALGSIDKEQIIMTAPLSSVMFTSVTVQSIHRGEGEPYGTKWTYINVNDDMIKVLRNGRLAHYVVRCD